MPAGNHVAEVPRPEQPGAVGIRGQVSFPVKGDGPGDEVEADRKSALGGDRRVGRVPELKDRAGGPEADVTKLEVLLLHDDVRIAGL